MCIFALLLVVAPSATADGLVAFERIPIRGGTLQLERGLVEHRDEAVAGAEAFIERSRMASDTRLARRRLAAEAIAAVNDLLGVAPDATTATLQQKTYASLVGGVTVAPDGDFTLYVLLQATAKSHLKAGGVLPNLSLNPDGETVTWAVHWGGKVGEDVPPMTNLVLPVEDAGVVSRLGDLSGVLDMASFAVALHEVAEVTLVKTLEFKGFQRRWFCDGMANAVAVAVLARLGEEQEQWEWLEDFARHEEQYAPLRHRVNLRYWLAKEYEVEAPLPDEEMLTHARYHFATRIIQGLVDRHGEAILARIVGAAIAGDRLSADDTLALLDRVTGEPVADLVRSHDEHPSDEAAATAYSSSFAAATEAGDKAAALSALLRLMEVRMRDTYLASFYARAANLLRELGHVDAGAAVLQQQLRTARNVNDAQQEKGLVGVYHSLIVTYALDIDRPALADVSAEALLAENPRFLDALTIRAGRLAREGDAEGAREIARRLRRDAPEKLTPEIQRILDRIEPRHGN